MLLVKLIQNLPVLFLCNFELCIIIKHRNFSPLTSCLVWFFKVVKTFEGDNDRLKLMVLYCGEEDELVVRAATGALAMMTHNEKICKKVLEVETQTTSTNFLSLSIT